MIQSSTHWVELIWTRGLRIAAILILAFLAARLWKAITSRLVEISKVRTAARKCASSRRARWPGYSTAWAWIYPGRSHADRAYPNWASTLRPWKRQQRVASLALGFGAQNLVRDLINGFFIVFEDQFVVGDLIQANGETGPRGVPVHPAHGVAQCGRRGGDHSQWPVGQLANLSRDWSQLFVDVTVPSEEIGESRAHDTGKNCR